MGIRNVFKKNKAGTEVRELQISDPVSQNFDYGTQIPPWLNSYADLATVEVDSYVHPARDRYYDAEKRGFAALQTFGSTTWVHSKDAKDDISLRSSSSSDDGSVAIVSPPPYQETTQPERRGLRKRLFRNRGLNADGTVRDEYDDLSMPDWGIPDEFATPAARRRFW